MKISTLIALLTAAQTAMKEDGDVWYKIQEGENHRILGLEITSAGDRLEVTLL